MIKETIFELTGFKFDGEIKLTSFNGVHVQYDGNTAVIGYNSKSTLARGYFLLAKEISAGKTEFDIRQTKAFDSCGVMLDMSRGGVMRVCAVKKYLKYMAALGMNLLMLYTEDTYEIKEYPFFGYLRGRYTVEELREIDDYANELGIEVIPCIQTLGHLSQYLRWGEARDIKDTASVLLAGEPKTYEFIECAIKTIKSAFRSNRIHLGMDEAHDMGLGNFLDKNGFQNRFEIFNKHLGRVCEICDKYDLKPMIWSDMYFTLDGNMRDYDLRAVIPNEVIRDMPNVDMVFWNYFEKNKNYYDVNIKIHKSFGKEVIFAGGINTWDGFLPNLRYTFEITTPALQACISNGVKTVIATKWSNDGCETNHFLGICGLPIFSEYCYLGEYCTDDNIYETMLYLTKMNQELTCAISDFYLGKVSAARLGKALFYCDPLYNLIGYDLDFEQAEAVYGKAIETIKKYESDENFEYYLLLFEIALKKCRLIKNLREKYLENDTAYLRDAANNILPQLNVLYAELFEVHKKQWFETYKAEGFEVINARYGGIMARVDYAAETIKNYLSGDTKIIEELEPEIYSGINRTWSSASQYMNTCLYS